MWDFPWNPGWLIGDLCNGLLNNETTTQTRFRRYLPFCCSPEFHVIQPSQRFGIRHFKSPPPLFWRTSVGKKTPRGFTPKKTMAACPPLRFFALNKKTFFEFYHQIFKKIRMFSVENISCWKSLEVRFKDHFSSGTTSSLSLKKWDCVEWNTFDGLILWKNWCLGDEVFPFGACFPG